MKDNKLQPFFDLVSDLSVGSAQKAALVLLLGRLKPAIYFDTYSFNRTKPMQIKQLLVDIGLKFVDRNVFDNKNHICSLTVSWDSSLAFALHEATDIKHDDAVIGRLLGYPETAIKAFVSKKELLHSSLYPDNLKNNPLGFSLSLLGKAQEILLIKNWEDYIRINSPRVFNELYEPILSR